MSTKTFDEAERIAGERGIDLSHDCDEDARECTCADKHASGDVRCPDRARHTACSHDLLVLAEL